MKKPNALDYLSIRDYVTAYDEWAQHSRPGYSKRNMARWSGIKSPNFISLVINNKRILKGSWLDGFLKAAKLSKNEEQHLRKLSDYESSRAPNDRENILQEVYNELHKHGLSSLASDQLEIMTQPAAWIVYHMLDLIDQESRPIWFKQRLSFLKLTSLQIAESILLLKRLGLVEEKNGQLFSKEKKLLSQDQIKIETNATYHKNVLEEAAQALSELLPSERAFGSMTATVAGDKLEALQREISQFGHYLTSKYASREPVDGEVVRLNIQFYSLTKKRKIQDSK